LWDRYLKARQEHRSAIKAFSEAEGAQSVCLATAGKLAFEAKERCRAELADHESTQHR
jgi:hypothetical protein